MIRFKEHNRFVSHANQWVASVVWNPTGNELATANYEGTIDLWVPHTGRLLKTLGGFDDGLTLIAFSPDGSTLAGCNSFSMDEPIRICEVETERCWTTSGTHEDHVNQIQFSPDGKSLVSAAENIKLWEVRSGELLATLDGITTTAFSENGDLLAIRDRGGLVPTEYGAISLWNVLTHTKVAALNGSLVNIYHIICNADGTLIVGIGTTDVPGRSKSIDTISIWNTRTLQELSSWQAPYFVAGVVFHPKYDLFATFGTYPHLHAEHTSDRITLWDAHTGAAVAEITGLDQRVKDLAFDPTGDLLAGVYGDRTIQLWRLEDE